jgi:hypothetical protein
MNIVTWSFTVNDECVESRAALVAILTGIMRTYVVSAILEHATRVFGATRVSPIIIQVTIGNN